MKFLKEENALNQLQFCLSVGKTTNPNTAFKKDILKNDI